jgi:hypothetical protein
METEHVRGAFCRLTHKQLYTFCVTQCYETSADRSTRLGNLFLALQYVPCDIPEELYGNEEQNISD